MDLDNYLQVEEIVKLIYSLTNTDSLEQQIDITIPQAFELIQNDQLRQYPDQMVLASLERLMEHKYLFAYNFRKYIQNQAILNDFFNDLTNEQHDHSFMDAYAVVISQYEKLIDISVIDAEIKNRLNIDVDAERQKKYNNLPNDDVEVINSIVDINNKFNKGIFEKRIMKGIHYYNFISKNNKKVSCHKAIKPITAYLLEELTAQQINKLIEYGILNKETKMFYNRNVMNSNYINQFDNRIIEGRIIDKST